MDLRGVIFYMKKAKLTINTQVDNASETSASYEAEIELIENNVLLRYEEQGAKVTLALNNGEVCIDRVGDYTFSLRLSEGKELPASLGIMGSSGDIKTQTHSIHYSITEKSFLLSIKYALIFAGDEKQEMKLRLIVRF